MVWKHLQSSERNNRKRQQTVAADSFPFPLNPPISEDQYNRQQLFHLLSSYIISPDIHPDKIYDRTMLPQDIIKSVPKDTWGIQISVQSKVVVKVILCIQKETHRNICSFSESQGPEGSCISIILCPRSWLQASHLQKADLTVLTKTELQNYHLNPCKVHRKMSSGRKINNKLFHSIMPVVLLPIMQAKCACQL